MRYFLLLLVLVPPFVGAQSSRHLRSIIQRNEQLLETNPSKAIDSLHYVLSVAKRRQLLTTQRDVLDKLTTISMVRLHDYERAMGYMEQLKTLADATGKFELRLFYENKLGELYYYNEETRKRAFTQFKRALRISNKSKSLYRRDHILCNYGIVQSAQGHHQAAIRSYREALRISRLNKDDVIRSAILTNIGVTFIYLQQPDSSKWYFEQSLKVARTTPEKTDDVERYLYLGLFNLDLQDPVKALEYLKAAEVGKQHFLTHNDRALLYKSISRAHEGLNDYKNAYENRLTELAYRDSSRQADISLQTYLYDYKLKMKKLEADKEHTRLWLIVVALAALLAIVSSYFIIKRAAFQRRLLTSISENERLEKERAQFEIEVQDREIAAKSMHLLEKDNLVHNLLNRLTDSMEHFSDQDRSVLLAIMGELKGSLNHKRWEEFEWSFEKVHPHFFRLLEADFPTLSPNERKLCAFLSLNMSTKEIGLITGQSAHSITIARARLRKKLGLTHSDTDLIQFLRKYDQTTENKSVD